MGLFTRKRKYADEVHGWDIPNSGIYLGRIVKNNKKFFFSKDELSKHAIIAGSTGSGKTVAGQIICEELLKKGVKVIVFDPTAQWSGMLKPNEDRNLTSRYDKFGMRIQDNNGFLASIIQLSRINTSSLVAKESLTILDTSKLTTAGLEAAIAATVKYYFENAKESNEIRQVIVFEEIHRILPKFGGSGKALNDIERAVREFRKWGVGIILISQVLEDFVGAIRANIATELQFKTNYEADLNKIKTKYGENIAKSIVMAKPSHVLFHNSQYNIGQPMFIEIRPPLHQLSRLNDKEYNRYLEVRKKLDDKGADKHAYNALYSGKYEIAESYANMGDNNKGQTIRQY